MPYPFGYEGPSYLQQGSFNSFLLGRIDYSSLPGGYGRGPLLYNGFSSYPAPYVLGSAQYPMNTGMKYLSPATNNELGSPGLSRRLKGFGGRLPSLKPKNRDRLAVFHTENIDVTTPRTAQPSEISRDRQEGYSGTIRRGRTVIRMETQHLKDNPSLMEQAGTKKKPKKTAGQKLKEKYLVGSVKKRRHSGYRRPTLNDLRAQQDLESPECSDSGQGAEYDNYYKGQASDETGFDEINDQVTVISAQDPESIACDQEIQLILSPPLARDCQQTIPEDGIKIEDEPEVVTLTLRPPKKFLDVLPEEDDGPIDEPNNSLPKKLGMLDLNSTQRKPSISEFQYTIPLPRVKSPTQEDTREDVEGLDYRNHLSSRKEPENPDDFWARYNTPERRSSVKRPSLKLNLPAPNAKPLSPQSPEKTDNSDPWGDRSPTRTPYFRRSINTILEKNESQELAEEAEDEDTFDFWGNEKRPSYHCMRKPLPTNLNQSTCVSVPTEEEPEFDFWSQEKRPSYYRFRNPLPNHRNSIMTHPSTPPRPSPSPSPPKASLNEPQKDTSKSTSLSPVAGGLKFSKKKLTDSGFFESPSAISPKSEKKLKPILLPEKKPASEVRPPTCAQNTYKNIIENIPVAPSNPLTTTTEKCKSVAKSCVKTLEKVETTTKQIVTKTTKKKSILKDEIDTRALMDSHPSGSDSSTTKIEKEPSASPLAPPAQTSTPVVTEIQSHRQIISSTKAKISSVIDTGQPTLTSPGMKNPTIERLKQSERNSTESSGSEGLSFDEDSPNVTPKSSTKEGSTSTSSSTLSAGTSTGSSRRMPSPPSDYDSDEESKGKQRESGNWIDSRTCPSKGRPKYRTYHLNDFQFLKVLGKGSFGKVLLAELKGSDSYFAIKCLKKDVVLEDDDVECTMIERKVLLIGSKHPYLCHLLCTFQSESHLFFAMEYLNGGDLMFHIQHDGRFSEERARFYGAEIVSGLKFLHKKGVIYRDLKLDNILLDFEGHVRIADFGMCKLQIFLDRTADTFCGTPDYMSPEIIKGIRYNQCVDWWAFGVLLYEMLVGQSPFSGTDEDELFWSICNEPVHFPRFLGRESKRILELLLEKDGYRRLGSPGSIYGDIKDTAFFTPIDWDKLERRELEPPFKPKLRDPLDVKYFDTTFTKEVARLTPVDKQILRSMDQTQFDGFSYTNPHTTD